MKPPFYKGLIIVRIRLKRIQINAFGIIEILREFAKVKNYNIADNYPLTYYTGQGMKSLAGP